MLAPGGTGGRLVRKRRPREAATRALEVQPRLRHALTRPEGRAGAPAARGQAAAQAPAGLPGRRGGNLLWVPSSAFIRSFDGSLFHDSSFGACCFTSF